MNYIHETLIRDIVDLAKEIKDTDATSLFKRNKGPRSIADGAEQRTMTFPVLCSSMLGIEISSMVSKALERKHANMLSMLFTSFQLHDNADALDYLSRFHRNLNINNSTVDNVKDALDIAFREYVDNPTTDYIISEKKQLDLLNKDIKNINHVLDDNISENTITDFGIIPQGRYGSMSVIKEKGASGYENEMDLKRREDRERREEDKFKLDAEAHADRLKSSELSRAKDVKDYYTQRNLLDTDVKKANEMLPTTLVVNFHAKDGNNIIPISIIVGVKSKIHIVDSLDVMERLSNQGKNANTFNKLIRASTREISFLKDFLFAIDQAKVDALSQSRRGSSSKLWKILERRGTKSRIKRRFGMNNDAMPISTLVITQEEVEYMKKEYNVDFENESIVRKILDVYNFIGFVIVDQVNESVKLLFDTGDDIFEELSFSGLEKEVSDGSYKKMVNLMTKVTK